jgi:O-antigen ligase
MSTAIVSSEIASVPVPAAATMRGTGLAYAGVFIFTFAYFVRPDDFWSPARFLYLAMVGGGLAIAGFFLAVAQTGTIARRQELKLLLLLLVWFVILVPTSNWPGGSFKIFNDYIWKSIAVTIVLANVVTTLSRLHQLMILQIAGVTVIATTGQIHERWGRLYGSSAAFGNPNDLAVLIAITLPLVAYFAFTSRRILWKGICAVIALVMLQTAVQTLSRAGFLALLASALYLIYRFGSKGRRKLLALVGAGVLTMVIVMAAPAEYGDRMQSIVDSELDQSYIRRDATGSREARIELLKKGIEVAKTHPVFGVGPGQFAEQSGVWKVAHNTYLQFATECGIPGLVIFLFLLRMAFKNLARAERVFSEPSSHPWMLITLLRASLVAFLVGVFFANWGYLFVTYLLIGYTAAVDQIAGSQVSAEAVPGGSSLSAVERQ